MPDGDQQVGDGRRVSFGESIYDADGRELGRVRGLDEHGFYVTTADGVVAMSVEHEVDTMAGEKELMWRCRECGEMGELEGASRRRVRTATRRRRTSTSGPRTDSR